LTRSTSRLVIACSSASGPARKLRIDGQDLLIMKESDIMGVIEQTESRQEGRVSSPSAHISPSYTTGGMLMAAKDVQFSSYARDPLAARVDILANA
jgi:hypothetical protein